MQLRTIVAMAGGTLAAAALAQTASTVEPKTAGNAANEQAAGNQTLATPPAASAAPGRDARTAPPANGTAPIEPKR